MTIATELTDMKTNAANVPPRFEGESQQCVTAHLGDDVTLTMQLAATSSLPTAYTWTRGDQEVLGDRYRFSENNNTVLLSLQHVTEDDVGLYTLIAKNAAGEARRTVEFKLDEGRVDAPVFLRRLSDLAVKVGTRTRFLVEIRSASDIKVTWYHNDHLVQEGERFTFLHEGNFFCVDVAPVMVEDGGRWTCMAENTTGRSSCSSHLNVLVPKAYKSPEFLEELKALLTEQGTVSLECKVVGVPTPVLHWFKDGKEIKAGDIFALTANPDDPTSLGTYTCEAVNCMGKTYSSSRVHVVGKGSREGSLKPADSLRPAGPPPIFCKELLPVKAKIGDTITLACKVTVPPWPKTIAWYNFEGRVDNSDKYHIMEDGIGGYMLEVSPVELVDEGEWKCVATSSEGAMGISKSQVSISYPKNFRKPRFLESLKAILTEEGLVSFECKVVGFPTPQLRWFKDGQELRPGDVYQLTGTNSLGSYSCIAKNCMGEATSSAELTVEDIQNQLNEEERLQLFSTNQPPKFIQGLKSCEGKINEDFRFTVQVSISPEPTVSWYRDDEHVLDSERYHMSHETLGYCHLDIHVLEIVDQAEWKCVATNEFGHSVTSCFLKLSIPKHFKKPRFLECLRAILSEEGAVNLECKVIGVPQPVLKWYKDGEELKPGDIHRIISGQDGTCCLGTYTCEAHNCMGTVASSASLLGFEDRMLMKSGQQRTDQAAAPAGHIIARNPSLSTIHEERTSQMYDTPATEHSLTVDERPEISFSFDGKEVSVSLYETPDLTEEEALQVVEMYAEQLSEHVSEHNIVDLPPMRFVKESSHSGKLLMEAVVIDVTGDYFTTAEDDLRTDADVEELSITDDAAQHGTAPPPDLEEDVIPFDKLNAEFMERVLVPTVPFTGSDEVSPPKRPPRRKSETSRISEAEQAKYSTGTYHSISPPKGGNDAKKSPQTEEDRSEVFSDAQAFEYDTPSKYETFVSARGSAPIMKEEEFAYQVTAIEEQKTELLSEEHRLFSKQHSTKSSQPQLVRNTQTETKKRKGETADDEMHLRHSESKVESSTQTGSLKKKIQRVEINQGNIYENVIGELSSKPDLQGTSIIPTDSAIEKYGVPMETDMSRHVPSAEKVDKDDSYSEEGDGLKTRGNIQAATEDIKVGQQKAKSKSLKRRGSKKIQSEKFEEKNEDTKLPAEITLPKGEVNESQKGESATKKKRLSTTDLDLPTLPTLEKHPDSPKLQTQGTESEVLEALTRSLQDIQKGLSSVEEKVISENIDEPASAISSLSVLESLSHPIQNIQKGLALVEQHSGSSSEEYSIGKTGLILEKLTQPIQELQRGLELVEEKVIAEKGEESLLERTILQNVAQPVEELKRGMALIKKQAFLESADEASKYKLGTHNITEEKKLNEKLEALKALWQPIQELQTGISILRQQALSQISGELETENAGIHILTTLEKTLNQLKQHIIEVEQQIVLEDVTKCGNIPVSMLEGVFGPIQELQNGLALVEQQAVIEAEDGFEPDIMRCSILKTLSKPIKELEKHLVEIKNTCASDIPLGVHSRSSPDLQTLEQSIQELTREIVTIAKLAVLKKKSDSQSLATLGNLAPPLLKLQKELVQVERNIIFENLVDPEKSIVPVPSLKNLSFPLTELLKGLTVIKHQLEAYTGDLSSSELHIQALTNLSLPLEILKKNILTIQQEILSGSSATMESKAKLKSLIKPFQELQRGLIQVEQVVLEVAPELIPQTTREPVIRTLTQSVHSLERKLISIQRFPVFAKDDSSKGIRTSLCDMAHPLFQLKKMLVHLYLSSEMHQQIDSSPELSNLAAAGVLIEPLLTVKNALDELEKQISYSDITETKDPCKCELLLMIKPITDLKLNIKAVQRQAVLEPTSSKVEVIEALIKPLHTLQDIIQNIKVIESQIPRKRIIHELTQSVSVLQKEIDFIGKYIISLREQKETKEQEFALDALKQPLEQLTVELNRIQKEEVEISEHKMEAELKTMTLLSTLSESLKSFHVAMEDVYKNVHLISIDGANSELQYLSEPVQRLQKDIAAVQHQAVLESGEVSENEGPSTLETLFYPLQMLQKGLVTIECQAVGQVYDTSDSKIVESFGQTVHQLEKNVSFLQYEAELETGLAKCTLSAVGSLVAPLQDIQRGLVLIEQQILHNREKEIQSEIANLSILENLLGPLEILKSDITNFRALPGTSQINDTHTIRKVIWATLEPLSNHMKNIQREINAIHQKALMEVKPAYGKSQVSVLQVLAQPLQDLNKRLLVIEELKIAIAREEQMTEQLEILNAVLESIIKLKQNVVSIDKCMKSEKIEGVKKQGFEILGNLTEPLQELHDGLLYLQDQIHNIPETESLPAASALYALKDLTKLFSELQEELTSIKNIALEPMSEQIAKKVRAATVKSINKSIQEIRKGIAIIHQQAVIESGSMSISATPSVLEILFKPLQKLQNYLSLLEETKLSPPQTPKLVEVGSIIILDNVLHSVDSLNEEIMKIEDITGMEPMEECITKLKTLTEPLLALKEGLGVIEHQIIESQTKVIPQSATLRTIETLIKPLNDVIQTVALCEQNQTLDSVSTSSAGSRVTNLLESIHAPILELEESIRVVQNQVAIESTEVKVQDEPFLGSIVQPLEDLKERLTLIKKCATTQINVHPLTEQCGLSALKALICPVEELKKKINILEQQVILKSIEIPSLNLSCLQNITESLHDLLNNINDIDQDVRGQCHENLLSGKIKLCQLKAIAVLIEQVATSWVASNSEAIPECTDDLQTGSIANKLTTEITQTINEIYEGLLKVEYLVVLETSDIPKIKQVSKSTAKILTSALEHGGFMISLMQSTTKSRTEESSAKTKKTLIEAVEHSLKDIDVNLFRVKEQFTIKSEDQTLSGSVSTATVKEISVPLAELQKGLSEIIHYILLKNLEDNESVQAISILRSMAIPIHKLQNCAHELEQGNSVPFQEANESILNFLSQETNDLRNAAGRLKQSTVFGSAHTEGGNISDPTITSGLFTLAELLNEAKKSVWRAERHETSDQFEESTSEKRSLLILKSIAQPLLELQRNLVQVEQVILENKEEPLSDEGISAISALAQPVRDIQHEIVTISQQLSLEEAGEHISEEESICILQNILKPVEELHMAIAQIELQGILETTGKSVSDEKSAAVLRAVVKPIKQFHITYATVNHQTLLEPGVESISEKSSLTLLKTFLEPLHMLHESVVQIQQQSPLESLDDISVKELDLTLLRNLAKPIEEMQQAVVVIEQQIALEEMGGSVRKDECISLLKSISKPVEEMHRQVAQIEEQLTLEAREETMTEEVNVTTLQSVAKPIREMYKALLTLQQQILEAGEETMSEKTNISLLKTLAEPLHQLNQHIEQIDQQIPLEFQDEPSTERFNISLLKTLAQPAQEIQHGIAMLEHQLILENTGESISEQNSLSVFQTLAQPIVDMHTKIVEVQQQVPLDTKEKFVLPTDVLQAVAMPIQELYQYIVTLLPHMVLEPKEESLSERTCISTLKTLAQPLQELHGYLVQVEQQVALEPHDESMSEGTNLSLLKSLAHPVEEIQHGIAMIEQQVELEADGKSISEGTHVSILHALAQPVEELYKCIAQIEQNNTIEVREETMSEKSSISLLKTIAQPIRELHEGIITHELSALEIGQSFSEKGHLSLLQALARPVHELHQGLAVIEQLVPLEPKEELIPESRDISLLLTLAHPIYEIQKELAKIEQQIALEAVQTEGQTSIDMLYSMAEPLQELQRNIATIELHDFLETTEKGISIVDLSLIKALVKPLQELERGILLISEQEVLEGLIEPTSEDGTNVSDLPTLASSKEVSRNLDVVNIEEQFVLEGDLVTLSEKSSLRDAQEVAAAVNEPYKTRAIGEYRAVLKHELDSLSEAGCLTSYSAPGSEEKVAVVVKDDLHKGVAASGEQHVISASEMLTKYKQSEERVTAAITTVSERGIALAETQQILSGDADALQSFKAAPVANATIGESSLGCVALIQGHEVLSLPGEYQGGIVSDLEANVEVKFSEQFGLATTEQQELCSDVGNVTRDHVNSEDIDVYQTSLLAVPLVEQPEMLQEEHVETLSNIESLSKEEYAIESDASLQEAAAIEEHEALMNGSSLTSVSEPQAQVAIIAITSQREAIELEDLIPLSNVGYLTLHKGKRSNAHTKSVEDDKNTAIIEATPVTQIQEQRVEVKQVNISEISKEQDGKYSEAVALDENALAKTHVRKGKEHLVESQESLKTKPEEIKLDKEDEQHELETPVLEIIYGKSEQSKENLQVEMEESKKIQNKDEAEEVNKGGNHSVKETEFNLQGKEMISEQGKHSVEVEEERLHKKLEDEIKRKELGETVAEKDAGDRKLKEEGEKRRKDKEKGDEHKVNELEEAERKKIEANENERKEKEKKDQDLKSMKKAEEERLRKEQEDEFKRKEAEKSTTKREEEEEDKSQKMEQEEAKRKKIEADENERKEKEKEGQELKSKQKAEEERLRKEREDEIKRKEMDEVTAKRKEEEEKRQKKEQEEAKRRKNEAAENERKENEKKELELKIKLKAEEERLRKEQNEIKRKEAEEAAAKRKEEEENCQREEQEAAERKKIEADENERKEKEKEEQELKSKQIAEEERLRKEREDEIKRKEMDEVIAKRKEEEEKRQKKEQEEAKRRKNEAAENERKENEKKELELKIKVKAEEERLRKEQNEIKRKEAEEAAAKRKEEENCQRKEQEEAERKKIEADENERKEKEKEEQELKSKQIAEEERLRKEREDEIKRKEMDEVIAKRKEEEEKRQKKEQDEAKRRKNEAAENERKESEKKELELKIKVKAEEESLRKEQNEIKRKEAEEAAAKRKEEENCQMKEQKEAQRKKIEADENERKEKENKEQELKSKQKAEEVRLCKEREDEIERKEADEVTAKRKEEEEKLQKKEQEEAKRRKNEAAENERKESEKKELELKIKVKAEEESLRKEQNEIKRKEAEEAAAKRKEEEENCQRKEREEAERKKIEADENELKEKEKEKQELKSKQKAEEERLRKEREDEIKRKEMDEVKAKRKEEEEKRQKKEQDEAKRRKNEAAENERKENEKKELELKIKVKAEEERLRKEQEDEIKRKKAEEVEDQKAKEKDDHKKYTENSERVKVEVEENVEKGDDGNKEMEEKVGEINEKQDKGKKSGVTGGEEKRKKSDELGLKSVNKRKKDDSVAIKEERMIDVNKGEIPGEEERAAHTTARGEIREQEVGNMLEKYTSSEEEEWTPSDKRGVSRIQDVVLFDEANSNEMNKIWVAGKVTQRSRSYDAKSWKEDSVVLESSLEGSDTLTPSESSTLTSLQRSKPRYGTDGIEDRSVSSLEDLPSDVSRRRTGPREKVESGPRDYRKKPVFCTRLTDRTAAQGSRIKLTCSVLGSPDPEVHWLRDGLPLEASKKFRTTCEDGLACLEVLDAAPGDSGEYTCVARNLHGESSSTANLKVFAGFEPAPFPPTFTRAIRDVYHVVDDELMLECRVRSQPAPRITWLKNGVPISPSSRYQQSELQDGVCRLSISSPDAVEDSGQYTCRAENALWSDQISSAIRFTGREQHLTSRRTGRVNGSRVPRDVKRPHFTNVLTDHLVTSGGTIALQVEVRGSPKPEVTWLCGPEEIPFSPKYRTFEEAGVHTLMVADASETEAGMYTCRAYNAYGHMDTSAAVQVVPPGSVRGGRPAMFVSRPDNVMAVSAGEDITVSFRVIGDPKPRVTWMKGTQDITNSQRSLKETIDDYVRLTLKRALPSDAGTYCILAKNVYGCDRSFVTMRIRQRARSLTPGAEGRLQETAIILRDVRDEVERTRLKDVPEAVTSEPVVTDSGRNWLTLSWPKSEHRSGVPVLAYRVEAWEQGDAGGARWVELGVSPINSFDAFNLKPGCEYKFRVTPRNRYGWGESVTTSKSIVLGKPVVLPEFIHILPGQLKALQSSNIRLECQVRGDPIPEVRWYRDGTELDFRRDHCPRFSTSFNGNLCVLEINDLKDEDTGRYMCEATNKEGRVSTFARLMVVSDPKIWEADAKLKRGIQDEESPSMDSPPQFTMRLRDRRVQMTYPVRLTCQVAGRPTPELVWSKDGQELKQDDRHTLCNEEHFHTLELCNTTLEDSGCYSATARNAHGSVSCRCHLVVDKGIRAYVAPEFIFELEPEYSVKEGGNLRLSAQVEAYPTVGVMWHRDGVRLRPSRRTIMTLDHDGTVELSLAGVTVRDAGVYSCTATNEVGRCETIGRVSVMVTTPPPAPKPPQVIAPDLPYSKVPLFITKPRSTEAIEGDTVIIHCEVVGDPKPDVVWLRDWLKPDYYRDAPHFRRVGEGPEYRLEIPRAKLDYTGAYSVIARNCHGEAKAVISLQIYAKGQGKDRMDASSVKHGKVQTLPIIKRELKDLRCCDGDAVTLECHVFAIPTPDIRWEKGGRLVPIGGDFSVEFDGETARLSIHQVFPEDEGEYTCVAYNELGRALTSACLVVDVPEEKETLLSKQLSRPPGLLSAGSTPRSTPRTTPTRSKSPSVSRFRDRDLMPLDTGSRPRRLKVAAPKFYAVPHNRVAEEGETVRFQCAIAGHPTPWVTWDKDGLLVAPSARLTLSEKDDLRVLQVEEVTPEDAGLYRVTLENEVGRVEASARLEVIGRYGSRTRGIRAWSASPRASPTFGRRLIGSAARVGGRLALACDLRGSPTPATTWYRNGEMVVRSERVTPSWDGRTARLEIEPVELEDAGVYTCVAENEAGKTSCSAKVDILDENDESDRDRQPPHFLQGLSKETMTVDGQSLELQVRLQGTAPIDVVWIKDNSEIPDCEDFRYVDYGDGRFALRIADVFPQDAGEYRCEAFSPHGEPANTSGRLLVQECSTGTSGSSPARLSFTKKPSPVLAAPGDSATFCARWQIDAPAANVRVTWSLAGRPVLGSSRFKVEEQGDVTILHISRVEPSDAGAVTCLASADSGDTVSCSCNLLVPADEDAMATMGGSSENDVLSMSDRDDAADGTPAMLLRGPADTTALRGNRVMLKATFIGCPTPIVRWLQAGRELEPNDRISIATEDGMSCLVLQNITADDSGKYVVSVENIFGADCHFASVAVEGPPDPPAGRPTVSPCEDGAIVTWSSSPYDGGCMVTGYCVEMCRQGTSEWQPLAHVSNSFSYVVQNLTPGENYMFRVRAENIHGESEPSIESAPFAFQLDIEDQIFTPAFEPRLVMVESGDDFKMKYDILEELGKGRYGVVHKVVERTTNQRFAAKFIRCIKAKDREKVQEEIDIMNCLRHPKLLQLAAAFESPREMVMVMEYISGGELFERVVADDFTLTERDCILFMRQICEGVDYMHQNLVVHLDLKPENIMCHTRTSHQIKLIDFGLARKLQPHTPVRVLFGTPEFIPPEIINYEPIGVESDMWSVGVICYVLLSGLSPFMGDSDAETFANITRADYDFDDEAFDAISQDAKDFISNLLLKRKEKRLTAKECLQHIWLAQQDDSMSCVKLSTDKLKKFIIRRKWQKTGNAIRALGRMATLSAASRRNSNASSTSGSPRPSLSGGGVSRMSSLNEEDQDDKHANHMNGFHRETADVLAKPTRMHLCSERSDSGISDCSSITTPTPQLHQPVCQCPFKPLLGKKFSITEEVEYTNENVNQNFINDFPVKTHIGEESYSGVNRELEFNNNNNNNNNKELMTKVPISQSEKSKVNIPLPSSVKFNLSSSSPAKCVKKTTCLKQQETVDSGVHLDVGGSVKSKVNNYMKNCQQQDDQKIEMPKRFAKEVTGKLSIASTVPVSTKNKLDHTNPAISPSNEHSTSYQKAMAFWKR